MGVVRLPVITGPTGSGKSSLALLLAEETPVTIISADSRQLYRGFDIGTAKPTHAERARIPHALVDVADPTERMGAARWAAEAERAIDDALQAGRRPVVVGGTGLYLRALFEPLFEEPPLDPGQRLALEGELARRGTESLREEVRHTDPARAHLGRTQLLRAIEIQRLTGQSISAWHTTNARSPRFTPTYLVVDQGERLAERLKSRCDAMIAAGWVHEVEQLQSVVPPHAPAWNATGYRVIHQLVAGAISVGTARQQILVHTRQFAKRQRTWFRHQLPPIGVTRVNLEDSTALDRVLAWWRSQEIL